jgi:hypothetical protein
MYLMGGWVSRRGKVRGISPLTIGDKQTETTYIQY